MSTKKKDTNKLPIAFKRKWVKALRSGKYEQATGTMYSPDANGYCCLGVACVINGINHRYLQHGYPKHSFTSVPSLLRTDKEGNENDIMGQLVDLNDTEKKTFKEIATYIEKNL
jgi:hypothetical protein